MDVVTATGILKDARAAADSGEGLSGTGFWKLVRAIKLDDNLERFIPDVAEIDQKAFKAWALLVVPLAVGTALMVIGTVVGLVLVALVYQLDGFWAGAWLLIGTGVLLVTTHGLGHLAVGNAAGIRFTSWFIGTLSSPQPGVKTDYNTYLRATPSGRAWMHASGAIVTKLVPFFLIGAAVAGEAPLWSIVVLIVIGVGTIITDVLWSTSASDWKKYLREMELVQEP